MKNRPDLVVFGSIASGLALGLLLVLVVFAGGSESAITGSALVALGTGYLLLALVGRQRWALVPGAGAAAVGLAVVVLAPGNTILRLAGWVWPVLLVAAVAWSFAGARRSLRGWSRRTLLYPALVVLLLVAIGGAFETVAEATSSDTAATGRTYLVAGHRLYLDCIGAGAPTVVLFSGLGERASSWSHVQHAVAPTTRVCAYDRAGEGRSGGSARPQDGRQLAADLHALLRAANVEGPLVLAGHSTGGVYALVYAAQYPEQVAGVALVDSATPYQFELPDYPSFYSMWHRVGALLPSLSRTGIGRITGALTESPRDLRADRVEFDELPRAFEQAKALRSLHGAPLAVLTAGSGAQRGWPAAQRKLARLSRNSVQQTVPDATHATLLDDPRFAAVTSRAITSVVKVARSGRR